jgi:hypothetical protein
MNHCVLTDYLVRNAQSRAWSSVVVQVNWRSKDAVLARACVSLPLPHLVERLRLAPSSRMLLRDQPEIFICGL